MGSFLRWRTS